MIFVLISHECITIHTCVSLVPAYRPNCLVRSRFKKSFPQGKMQLDPPQLIWEPLRENIPHGLGLFVFSSWLPLIVSVNPVWWVELQDLHRVTIRWTASLLFGFVYQFHEVPQKGYFGLPMELQLMLLFSFYVRYVLRLFFSDLRWPSCEIISYVERWRLFHSQERLIFTSGHHANFSV